MSGVARSGKVPFWVEGRNRATVSDGRCVVGDGDGLFIATTPEQRAPLVDRAVTESEGRDGDGGLVFLFGKAVWMAGGHSQADVKHCWFAARETAFHNAALCACDYGGAGEPAVRADPSCAYVAMFSRY